MNKDEMIGYALTFGSMATVLLAFIGQVMH